MSGPAQDIAKLEAIGVRTPAHLTDYVAALGIEQAMAFFLSLGGSQIYLSKRSGDRSIAAQAIGADNVERLAAQVDYGYIKVPLARQWIAQVMRAQGKPDNEIARIVRADVATVRKWLADRPRGEQLSLPI